MTSFLIQAVPAPCAPTVWYKDPAMMTAVATIFIAIATIVYVAATIKLWQETKSNVTITRESLRITKETFEQSVKPIVAVPELVPLNNTDKKELTFTLRVENYGSAPAVEVNTSAKVVADGNQLRVQKHETGNLLIPPHSYIMTTIILDETDYTRALKSARLDFSFSALYEGVADKRYQYDFEGVYYPSKGEFVGTNAKSTDLSQRAARDGDGS
jgi:archaellum component FlaG (FlaF/FlaG flagellin family)